MSKEKKKGVSMQTLFAFQAIKYLIAHSVYGNEWQGAGMWEAVCKLMKHKGKITEKYLNKLLAEAENR